MRHITIAVIGNANSGKSALLGKFMDPELDVEPNPSTDDWDYWEVQEALAPRSFNHTLPDGETVNVDFCEVPGSRGRSYNYFELHSALASADAVINTERMFGRGQWDKLGEYYPFMHYLEGNNKRKIPHVYVGTGIDKLDDDGSRAAAMSLMRKLTAQQKFNAGTFFTSAVTSEGIREAVEAAIIAGLARSAAKKKTFVNKLLALFAHGKKGQDAKTVQPKIVEAVEALPSADADAEDTSNTVFTIKAQEMDEEPFPLAVIEMSLPPMPAAALVA